MGVLTFAQIETSADNGQPLELMELAYLTNRWYYTSTDHSVVYNGNTYVPLPIKHSRIEASSDVAKAQITINIPQDSPIGDLFKAQPPSGVVSVTLFAKHSSDGEAKAIWKGRIVNAEWVQPWLNLTSESIVSSLQRMGLRRKYGAQCQHPLYSTGDGLCNVNKELYKQVHPVTTIVGAAVKCDALAGDTSRYYAGGYAEWTHATSGYLEKRMITESNVLGELILSSQPTGLVVGAQITVYPGCDHLLDTCTSKFTNELNYGGTPFIPKKNPFNGSTLY